MARLKGKFKTVSYGKTFNDGNFESTRIDVTFDCHEDDDEAEVFEECAAFVDECRSKGAE